MAIAKFAVNFGSRKYFLSVTNNEKLSLVKNRIELLCGVDFSQDDYVLEIYDSDVEEYVVLNQRYLTEYLETSRNGPSTFAEVELKSLHSERKFIHERKAFSQLSKSIETQQDCHRALCLAKLLSPARASTNPTGFVVHQIIWLDEFIGRQEDYASLKRFCASVMDIKGVYGRKYLELRDLENLVCLGESRSRPGMYFFDHPQDCYNFINGHVATDRIFLITSPKCGQSVIREVYKRVHAIYLLAPVMTDALDIIMDYIDYNILAFDVELDLLARLVRDIARFYIEQGQQQLSNDFPNEAVEQLRYARRLLYRADLIDRIETKGLIEVIDQQLEIAQEGIRLPVECEEM